MELIQIETHETQDTVASARKVLLRPVDFNYHTTEYSIKYKEIHTSVTFCSLNLIGGA